MAAVAGETLAMQPRIKLRSLFWIKSARRPETVWDVVGEGSLPMDDSHLAALEHLFLQSATAAAPMSGGEIPSLPSSHVA